MKADTLSAKLKTLRSIPEVAKGNQKPLERLAELIHFRADLVHGVMILIDIDDERFACLRNARHAAAKIQDALLISYKELKQMAEEIDEISSAFAG